MDFLHEIVRTGYDEQYDSLSPFHITFFVVFILGFVLIIQVSKRGHAKKQLERLEKICLASMAAAQIIYFFWFMFFETDGDKLPLYVCRIACILMLFTYFVHWTPLEHYAIFTALYGGVSALFYSSPKPFAFPHITRLAYFATHIGLAYSALLRILLHPEKFDRKSLYRSELINLIIIIAVLAVDIKFGWNYMFLLSPQLPNLIDMPVNEISDVGGGVIVSLIYMFGTWCAWLVSSWLQHRYGVHDLYGDRGQKEA